MSTTTNPPSNIFVATCTITGKIVHINVHHQVDNDRDVWTASSPGVPGVAHATFCAAGAAEKLMRTLYCEGLTEFSLEPNEPPAVVATKEPTLEMEFVELLKDYALALTANRCDPSAIGNTNWKLTQFVKALVEENEKLQFRVNQLEAQIDASYDNPWNDWR
jgi:hypothetical protein